MKLILKYNKIIIYGLISVFLMIVDVIMSKALDEPLGVVTANTVSLVSGFIIQFFLSSKLVFNRSDKKVFLVYLTTFVVALLLANSIVYFLRSYLMYNSYFNMDMQFYIAKGTSIVVPFFATYYLRKLLIQKLG